jgi:hypothetical protein
VWHGQKSWNGIAILACGNTPIEWRRVPPGDPGREQRALKMFTGKGSDITLL